MTSIEAKKIIFHAMELAFGFAPTLSKVNVTYFSDDMDSNDYVQIYIDFDICGTDYGLIYHLGEYQLSIKNFYGNGHDHIIIFTND